MKKVPNRKKTTAVMKLRPSLGLLLQPEKNKKRRFESARGLSFITEKQLYDTESIGKNRDFMKVAGNKFVLDDKTSLGSRLQRLENGRILSLIHDFVG